MIKLLFFQALVQLFVSAEGGAAVLQGVQRAGDRNVQDVGKEQAKVE